MRSEHASGGLTGWPATAANLSAVAVVLGLFAWLVTVQLPRQEEALQRAIESNTQATREVLQELRHLRRVREEAR